jgi:hypothetical protein
MSAEIKMTVDERRKYLRVMYVRYCVADKPQRSRLLDEMETVLKLHRKALIRLMASDPIRKVREKQRGKIYDHEVADVLRVVAESLDYICAERLTPCLAETAELLVAQGELEPSDKVNAKLQRISVSTVKELLKQIRQDEPRLPRRRPQFTSQLMREIPAGRIPYNIGEPGHVEVDTVHHCGPMSVGEYVHTLQMVDVATGWNELVAVLGRSALVMEAAFSRILARLPFPILELHPDNGSEFLNNHLYRFFKDTVPGLKLTRSRPWQKDDNRYVEEKNSSQVRHYLGFERYDTVAHVQAMNELYDRLWLYRNFFQPVLHISDKQILLTEGERPKVRRVYDVARTPFRRVCDSGAISPDRRQQLEQLRSHINPRRLRQEIHACIDRIIALPQADGLQHVPDILPMLAQPMAILERG